MELEGLRGLAAIVVVIYHSMIMFYPGIAYGVGTALAPVQNMRIEDNLHGNPLNVFLSGAFAVAIFFILSGFVLSIGFFKTQDESIIKRLASKRYLRLMLPALASSLLAFLVIILGLSVNRQEVVNIAHSGHLAGIWTFTPHLIDAIKEGIYGIFAHSTGVYNSVLWTMYYEFLGSIIVFVTLFVFGKSKYRWVIYSVLAMGFFNSWFLGIILGMILADLYTTKKLHTFVKRQSYLWVLLVVGLFLGGYPVGAMTGMFYSHLPMWVNVENSLSFGALFVIIAVLYCTPLRRFFIHKRINILGRYTYSLYLTHTLVLYTFGTTLFVLLSHHFGINMSALFSAAATLPVIVLVAWLFERYIDGPSIKFANVFSDIMLGRRELNFQLRDKFALGNMYVRVIVSHIRQVWSTRFSYDESEVEN